VVHDAEVNDRGERLLPKDVLGLLPADIDLVVRDVLRTPAEIPPIDADDRLLAVQPAGELPAETPADAGDEHGALRKIRRAGAAAGRTRPRPLDRPLGHGRCRSTPQRATRRPYLFPAAFCRARSPRTTPGRATLRLPSSCR